VRISLSQDRLLSIEFQVRDAKVKRVRIACVGDDVDPEAVGFHRERVEESAAWLPTIGLSVGSLGAQTHRIAVGYGA